MTQVMNKNFSEKCIDEHIGQHAVCGCILKIALHECIGHDDNVIIFVILT
jgi:hypothetical protein